MSSPLESFSQPVSEDLPSGENLEYDPLYLQMETLAKAKGESAIEGGDDAPSAPDWKGVEKLATELLSRTRDLRVQVYATIASIRTKGLPGFRDNLKLLNVFLDDFWDTVHPQLDPDDNNDPTLRLNTLQTLNEYSSVARALDRAKLVELHGLGHFSVRDVELAQGKESPEKNEEVPDFNIVRQAFTSAEPERLEQLQQAARESLELLASIDATWKDKSGEAIGPGFDTATKSLMKIATVLADFSPDGDAETAGEEGATRTGSGPSAVSGTVNSRSDVIRVLDRVCEYYSAQEPSSPVPLLLRRAQRLVEKSFMEILEDMVPDGVSQAKIVSGKSDAD